MEAFTDFSGPCIGKLPLTLVTLAVGIVINHPVLLDINMPRKDGFEACREMRALEEANPDRPKAQIIAVTALSAEEEKKHGKEYVHTFQSASRTTSQIANTSHQGRL